MTNNLSINNVNGISDRDAVTFSITNMNGYSGRDDICFRFTNTNGVSKMDDVTYHINNMNGISFTTPPTASASFLARIINTGSKTDLFYHRPQTLAEAK